VQLDAIRARLAREVGGWRVLVPIVCLGAGFLFATTARDSGAAPLRTAGTAGLAGLVRLAEDRVQAADQQVARLQAQVTRATAAAGRVNGAVAAAQRRVTPMLAPAGLTAVRGPGVQVVLDDAPSAPAGVDPNQVVVHQSDIQAVVNALWAGGAEAMSINGQRLIPTSAVHCVGPTLLLNGEVFSPPFRVAAIGEARTMQARLDASPGVRLFEQAASYYGLGYTVEDVDRLDLPAYTGPITLTYARASGR
jgi:uncharacterized protein YlxW (UPF0749 family)